MYVCSFLPSPLRLPQCNWLIELRWDRIVYIFVGSILLTEHWWNYTAGTVVGVVGVAYVVLEFIPQIEPPPNMREAEQGWGAEQV